MTGQHRDLEHAPRPWARWIKRAIVGGIAVLVPASLIAMRVGDALSVTAGEPAEPTTAATRTTAPAASFTPPVFAAPVIPSIGAEGHWAPPADATTARTTVASTPERRSAPRTTAPRYAETPKPTPTVVAPTLAAEPAPAPAPVPDPTPTETPAATTTPTAEPTPTLSTLPEVIDDVLDDVLPTPAETPVETTAPNEETE